MRIGGGSKSGGILDFSSTGGAACAGRRMEMKICEGYCGGLRFSREVPATARQGRTMCGACVRMEMRRRAMERTGRIDAGAQPGQMAERANPLRQ